MLFRLSLPVWSHNLRVNVSENTTIYTHHLSNPHTIKNSPFKSFSGRLRLDTPNTLDFKKDLLLPCNAVYTVW